MFYDLAFCVFESEAANELWAVGLYCSPTRYSNQPANQTCQQIQIAAPIFVFIYFVPNAVYRNNSIT